MPKRVSLADRTAHDTPKAPAEPSAPIPTADTAGLWSAEPERQEVVALDVQQIMPNPRQPRSLFDEAKLEELAASIRAHGVIQPIIVRPIPLTKWEGHARRYELIAGERRWRASMLADQPTIPALIREDAERHETLIELALIENLQRADLHPLEEALAFGTMRDELGYSIRRIAERVSRSKGYVENRLKLLDLDAELQHLVSERPDTLMHVHELAKVADPEARAELIEAVRAGLSYAQTQARVRAILTPDVSRRSDRHAREQDADHARAASSDVSLYKDTHGREQDADHAHAASVPRSAPAAAAARTAHDPQQHAADPRIITLSAAARLALPELRETLDLWLADPARLTPEDWELLAPIAQRLRDLLQRVESS